MVHQGLTFAVRAARALAAAVAIAAIASCATPGTPPPAPGQADTGDAPAAPREFRAAWVASVANIDWPSRPGLPAAEQQAEIARIVEQAAQLRLNALVVQVRPAADALYPSALEPWSEYLTGEQGKAPEPWYDPLQRWIDECHRRGIELHAWFNPYRARHSSAKSPLAATHVARAAPGLAKAYGDLLWMDPGEPAAAQRTLDVVLDVVRRYDVDGVHIDDYFYPYPVKAPGAANGAEVDFPDGPAWQAYLLGGGRLERADWRRANVDALVQRMHAGIHREKPWVRFGISPFGLGRPDRRPPGITGFSQYDKLYADVERWMQEGWLDYLAPQLYWPVDQAGQAFEPLMDYWVRQNPHRRHVWPGLFTSRIDATPKSWPVSEIARQVALTRTRPAVGGHVHFSMAALLENRRGIADQLQALEYAQPALVPATPWLGGKAPAAPRATVRREAGGVQLTLGAGDDGGTPWLYAVWARRDGRWRFHTLPASQHELAFGPDAAGLAPDRFVVSAIDRLGLEGPRVAVEPGLGGAR